MNPPKLVQAVVEALACLIGVQDRSWANMLKLIKDKNTFEFLITFDKDNVSRATLRELQKYVT